MGSESSRTGLYIFSAVILFRKLKAQIEALKFQDSPRWHCVWATVVEHDNDQGGIEVFRSYEDVYLQPVSPSRVSPIKWRTAPSPRKG